MPIYDYFDNHKFIRYVAETYVYTNPRHADFFVTSVLGLINASASIGIIFYWQLKHGSLPWWLIAAYYFSWVGTGGRMMGAAYALAHKEVCHSLPPPLCLNPSSLRVTTDLSTRNGFVTLSGISSKMCWVQFMEMCLGISRLLMSSFIIASMVALVTPFIFGI
jgi:hypothetical protein